MEAWELTIELISLMALFSSGFLVGHFVANRTNNIFIGLVSGFGACCLAAILYAFTRKHLLKIKEN
jgi:hypothetical protein